MSMETLAEVEHLKLAMEGLLDQLHDKDVELEALKKAHSDLKGEYVKLRAAYDALVNAF